MSYTLWERLQDWNDMALDKVNRRIKIIEKNSDVRSRKESLEVAKQGIKVGNSLMWKQFKIWFAIGDYKDLQSDEDKTKDLKLKKLLKVKK